ncbi:MAG: YfaZ family outer membrane protein, partial [Steroidobacteraceae bacterium]
AYAALLQEENNDVMAFSIGAEVRLDIFRDTGFAVVGRAFYAPDILTFGTADNLQDFSARAEYRLGPRLIGFAGMRWFRLDLTEGAGHQDLQDEVFVGGGYSF